MKTNDALGQKMTPTICLLALACLLSALFLDPTAYQPAPILLILGLGGLAAIAIWLLLQKRMTTQKAVFLLLTAGFVLRLAYILYTPVIERQNDVLDFTQDEGHAGYIKFFYENWGLPDFLPSSKWQFYHPPLHHFLAGMWMRFNSALGFSFERICENVQVLTLFYSCVAVYLCYRVLVFLRLKGAALLLPLALISFHPTFIVLGGSINNDMLMVLLSLAAVLATIRWYQAPSASRIAVIAVCVGLAMMAKTSGALVAPAIAYVLLHKLFTDRAQYKKYLAWFALFAVICVPLGLGWTLYTMLYWHMPPGAIPRLPDDSTQYLGNYAVWERFLLFKKEQFQNIFLARSVYSHASYYEYNISIAYLKTSVFGEFPLYPLPAEAAATLQGGTLWKALIGYASSVVLFWVNIPLILGTLAATGSVMVRKKYGTFRTIAIFLFWVGVVTWGSYIIFCFTYPHTCTQNFRYAVPTLLVGTAFLGKWISRLQHKKNSRACRIILLGLILLTGLFCLASITTYSLLA